MASIMRVCRISVSKLFGIFDHDISLNQEERITIIHGPNGYGKTVILQLMDALFNERWSYLLSVPFETFAVEFDDWEKVLITTLGKKKGKEKRANRHNRPPRELVFHRVKNSVL